TINESRLRLSRCGPAKPQAALVSAAPSCPLPPLNPSHHPCRPAAGPAAADVTVPRGACRYSSRWILPLPGWRRMAQPGGWPAATLRSSAARRPLVTLAMLWFAGCQIPAAHLAEDDPCYGGTGRPRALARQLAADTAVELAWRPVHSGWEILYATADHL